MDKLEKSLKIFSLVFSETVDSHSVYDKVDTLDVNTESCISLYDLLYAFNKMYRAFKKEYNELEKPDIGKLYDFVSFDRYDDMEGFRALTGDNQYKRSLLLYVDNSKLYNGRDIDMTIVEHGDEIFANLFPCDDPLKIKHVILDKELYTKYLDFFEKYSLLLEIFSYIRCSTIYGDGCYSLFINLNETSIPRFNTDIKSIKVHFGSTFFMSPGDHITIMLKPDEELHVDLENSRILIDDEEIDATEEDYFKCLKSVYVKGKRLEDSLRQKGESKAEAKVKMLKSNLN